MGYKFNALHKIGLQWIDTVRNGIVDALRVSHTDMGEPSGFIHSKPTTMGILELSPDGTTIHRINHLGIFSTNLVGHVDYDASITTFYNGDTPTAREIRITPLATVDGGDDTYSIYANGIKIVIGSMQSIILPNTSGLQYIYHNESGILQASFTSDANYFKTMPITSIVYGNATTQELVIFADERHGIAFAGDVHRWAHFSFHTKYYSGMEIQGVVAGSPTFTQVTSGVAFDEDNDVLPRAQPVTPHIYIEGTKWRITQPSNEVGYLVGGVAQYNKLDLGVYSLEDITGNDVAIMFLLGTNNAVYPYLTLLGQTVYANVNEARANLQSAYNSMVLNGLPLPEFVPVGAIMVNANGEVVAASDGSTILDLRRTQLSGNGTISGQTPSHVDLLQTSEPDLHPISSITGLEERLRDEPYEAYIWESTLNVDSVNILREHYNTPDIIKFDYTETINRIKIEIEYLGTGTNALIINFRVNGQWLLANDFIIPSADFYNFTTLINNTVVEGDEFEVVVIQAPGANDIGGMVLKVFTS